MRKRARKNRKNISANTSGGGDKRNIGGQRAMKKEELNEGVELFF